MNTSAELLEEIVINNDHFYGKMMSHLIGDLSDIKVDEEPKESEDKVYDLFQEDFIYFYSREFLDHLKRIYFEKKYTLQKDLSFFKDSKSKNDFLSAEVQCFKKKYDVNKYNYLFTIDNFYEDFFDVKNVFSLVDNLITEFEDNIYDLYNDDPRLQVNHEELDIILCADSNDLLEMAEILIYFKLIHIEQENNRKESPSHKKDNGGLTLNQKLLLIDKLVSTNNWTNLTQTRQAELIFLITNQNKDNIIKGLRKLYKKKSEKSFREKEDFEYIESITEDVE